QHWLLALAVALGACGIGPATTEGQRAATAAAPAHLRIDRGTFRTAGNARFEWRGISAFRLLEMVAAGRHTEAAAFMDWASRQRLTVLRVFVMARTMFPLPPAAGRAALPTLLEMAASRQLHVELVALADTRDPPFDILEIENHIRI